jgi:hypothetical protein
MDSAVHIIHYRQYADAVLDYYKAERVESMDNRDGSYPAGKVTDTYSRKVGQKAHFSHDSSVSEADQGASELSAPGLWC